ncbi:membrane-spanning 4-domains subfamily A member 6D-like [Erpetoichthys calabaricus]|uniref:Membrane-spanning 4-domains subfamily A member 6D-like n=1 Tax=Erpetoichthys calabaricus TaxID=27687 RepID=A0A8C4X9K4_ERPCA|nr:membrane-spanning 4-domains subfamily A member 6D-like [Erpetoichthys calabaricus]
MASTVSDRSVSLSDQVQVKFQRFKEEQTDAFKRGNTKHFGVSVIMLGVMVACFGVPMYFIPGSYIVQSGMPWWTSASFIVTGVLFIIMEKKANKISFWSNVISSVLIILVALTAAAFVFKETLDNKVLMMCLEISDNCTHFNIPLEMNLHMKSVVLLILFTAVSVSAVLLYIVIRERDEYGLYRNLEMNDLVTAPPVTEHE